MIALGSQRAICLHRCGRKEDGFVIHVLSFRCHSLLGMNSQKYIFKKWANPASFVFCFVLFRHKFYRKTAGVSGIQIGSSELSMLTTWQPPRQKILQQSSFSVNSTPNSHQSGIRLNVKSSLNVLARLRCRFEPTIVRSQIKTRFKNGPVNKP